MTQQDYNPNVLLTIQTTLSQYPILTEKIENEMYSRLVSDGYITVSSFSEKVRDFALLTQKREGLENPFAQEPTLVWEKRLERVRSMMICQEFAHRYTLDTFNSIVESARDHRNDHRTGADDRTSARGRKKTIRTTADGGKSHTDPPYAEQPYSLYFNCQGSILDP